MLHGNESPLIPIECASSLATAMGRQQRSANGGDAPCAIASSGTAVEPTTEQIHATVQGYIDSAPAGVGVAVGLASPSFGNRIVCVGSLNNQDGNPVAFTTDTPFEIASITKTFTASIYESFLQRGHICGSDPLGRFIRAEVSSSNTVHPASRSGELYQWPALAAKTGFATWPSSAMGNDSESEMRLYLRNPPFAIGGAGQLETDANLGFALLAAATSNPSLANVLSGGCATGQITAPLGMVKDAALQRQNR